MEKDCLDESVMVMLLELTPKIWDSQVYKRYTDKYFGCQRRRVQYANDHSSEKDEKTNKDGENRKGKRGGGGD